MKVSHVVYRLVQFCVCLSLMLHLGQTEVFGQQKHGTLKAERILFLGNSLTLHGPKAEIGWAGNWGMIYSTKSFSIDIGSNHAWHAT